MKKIINGKKYDTETATLLRKVDNTGSIGMLTASKEEWEAYYSCDSLYRKTTGEFFLLRQQEGKDVWIEPYTEEDAKKWSEEYLSGDKYEEIFGEVEE